MSDEEPPCTACPLENFQLFSVNQFAWVAFQQLDTSGRDIGFGAGFIREEAIDSYLQRYNRNEPEVYEAIKTIDLTISVHRNEQEKRKNASQH